MRSRGERARRRVVLLVALLAGYAIGRRVPDLWPELEALGYPGWWGAAAVEAPLHGLDAVADGRLPRAELAVAAAQLERHLDELVTLLHETHPGHRIEVPPAAGADVAALVADYRRVFPTFRGEREGAAAVLAAAGPPPVALLVRAGPALRAALTVERDELAALWAALQGRAEPPPVVVSRRAEDLVLRLDEGGIAGRVRVYGDERLVITGPGPEPLEEVRRLEPGGVEALAAALVAGGFLAPDRYEAWLAGGADGCRWLARNGRRLTLRRTPQRIAVTLSLVRVGPRAGAPGPALETVERRLWVPPGFLDPRCAPADAIVRRLQAGLSALRALESEAPRSTAAAAPAPGGERGAVLPPHGPAILFTAASGGGAWISDGRRCGVGTRALSSQGVAASPTGELLAFRQLAGLFVVDRAAGGAPRRVGPPDWYGLAALWSPDGDTLLLAGRPKSGLDRMFLADRLGRSPVPFGEAGAWPFAWAADGRGVYYRAGRLDRSLRFASRAGAAVDLELPDEHSFVEDVAPSPDGRFLAYRASHRIAGQPAMSLFTVRLDPATALPRAGARPAVVAESGRAYDWAPTGDSIVYAVRRAIREVGPDGRRDRRLVGSEFGECNYDYPRVSPDGRWLVFLRCTNSTVPVGHVYLARREGSGARRIGRGGWPVWIPAGAPRLPLDASCPE